MKRYARWTSGAVIAVAVAALGLTVATTQAQQTEQTQPQREGNIAVGTYDPERVFTAYPKRQELMDQLNQLQAEMQQAQQQQDQQRMIEIQQQFQQREAEAIQQFESDVNEALSPVADEHGLDLVAIEVAWTRDDVSQRDVTEQVIEELGGEVEPEPDFLVPGME